MMQKQDVVHRILKEYQYRTPINRQGLELLYDTAERRGYRSNMIYMGLKTCVCKNYVRSEYIPPNNDPEQEVVHERMYMEDWEFKQIFKMF